MGICADLSQFNNFDVKSCTWSLNDYRGEIWCGYFGSSLGSNKILAYIVDTVGQKVIKNSFVLGLVFEMLSSCFDSIKFLCSL